jgi:hypothetical protein
VTLYPYLSRRKVSADDSLTTTGANNGEHP